MVEVVHGLTGGLKNGSSLKSLSSSPRVYITSSRLVEDPMTAVRRTAATKRTLMKMKMSRNVSGRSNSQSDGKKSPNSPNSNDEDPKRSKADEPPSESDPESCTYSPSKQPCDNNPGNSQARSIFHRRMRNHSAPVSITPIESSNDPPEIVCDLSKLSLAALRHLLEFERHYRPATSFLEYVDPVSGLRRVYNYAKVADDKVDITLRNEAVHSLRFMHNAFFTLSAETFCKAVNLIDRFIAKVKVKPRYMACVATASYHIAAKFVEPDSCIPPAESLVQISHCGGTATDLARMEQIMNSKLGGDLNGVNAYDFLRLFAATAMVLPEGTTASSRDAESPQGQPLLPPQSLPDSDGSEMTSIRVRQSRRLYDIWKSMTNRLVVALCSLDVYLFSSQVVALSVLHHFNIPEVPKLAALCKVQMSEVRECSEIVEALYDTFYRSTPPGKKALTWNLSKRTLMRLGCSSPTTLDTISEDAETDREDKLQFMFEP